MLGATGVAAVEACPEWLEDLLKPRKTYFLPTPLASPDDRVFAALMAMYYAHDSPRAGFRLLNVEAPPSLDDFPDDLNRVTYRAMKPIVEEVKRRLDTPSPLFRKIMSR